MEETEEEDISITNCINNLTKHYLELYMDEKRAIVLHVKFSEKKYKKLRCLAYRKLYMKLHSPYIFPTKKEISTEIAKETVSENAITELSKLMLKFKYNDKEEQANKLLTCMNELENQNNEIVNNVLKVLLYLAGSNQIDSTQKVTLNYEKWNKGSSTLSDMFQFDEKSRNIFNEDLQHFNSLNGFNQDVFKSDMNLLFEKPPNHESLVLDEYLGKQMTFDRYEKEMEMSLFGGLVNSMTSSINISLTIPELQPTNPTDVFKPRASIESRVSSTDEGFHELSSSSATPEPLDNITNNIHHGLSIWDDAKDKNMGKDVYHGKGKLKGADDSLLKNYLTECDKTAFDCMFDISVSSIEKMTGKIYKVIVMQENVIYQHSKNVLIGIPSNVYIFNIMTCSIHPITNIRCSGISDDSLYGFMNKFAKIGTNFRRLNKFCYHHTEKPFKGLSGGLVLKAFVDAVQKILYSFWAAVFAIEDDVSLTLLKLWQLFERYGRQLQFLSDICLCSAAYKRTSAKEQKPKFPVGANLLSYLYTLAIENSSTDNSVLLLFLFKAVSKIYIRFVRDWLFNGTCDDPYNEFFVQVDDQYLNYRDKHYWTQGFQMKETKNAIPLYLDSLADHIYSCGKALNLLKLIDIKHYMFDQVIKPPVIGITFSSTKLDSIESESKKYLETVHKCQENYIAMKEKEKLERQQIFREKLEKERQSVKVVSDRIEALEKNVREAIQEKKHEQFLDLKQQFEEAVKLRKEMKEKKLEDDKYWLAEIRKQENKEDSIKQKAREDLISYYEKLSREAERRESKARWFISRHELTSKRIDFLNDLSERIKQMSADDEEAKKSWIEPMQYLPTYHNTQQNTLKSSNTEIPINNLDKDSQLIHSNLEGNAMKSLIYNASDNTSTIPQDQSQKPIEGSETKSLLYPGSIEHESQSHFPHNDTKQNDGTNMKNIIYDTKEQTTTERDNFQRITTNEEGKETKNLLYPSEIIISETSHVISEHSNEGNMTKSLLYPDETDGYPDQSAVVRKAFKVEGDETKNIIYSSIGKEISYQKKHDDKLGGDIAKAILYNEPAESVSKPLVKEFERPSVMQDVLYNQTNTNSEYVTKEFEKPSVMQEILYSDTKAINQHVTKEFEKPSVMQNILYSDENMTDVQREHVVRSFEQPSVMQDILYSEQSNVEKIERRNYRGFEPKVKIKDLMYPKDNIEVRKQVEIKELSKDEVWMDSMVEPFRDEYKIMDCDPQPNMFGDCQQFALPFVDDVKDIDADIIKKLPLETIIRRSLTVPILSQISLMNKALVDYFLVDLNIRDHFDAFRKFLLLEDGEFGHSLCNQLFSKVASGMKATDFCNTIALGNIISESVGISLYASSIEYSDQLKFATKWIPEVLQVSDIGVLDFLELRYRVPWPCNIVITENSINKYNKVFSFLLRLKKAGWSLQNVFTNLKRAANSRKSACSPQLRQLQLFRHEMLHFVNNLERYVVNQIIHVSWQEFQINLSTKVHSLDDLHKCHVNYLSKIIFRSLLSKNAEPVYKFINDIFSMISKFETRLTATPWQHDYRNGYITHPLFEKLKTVHAAFKQSAEFLFKVISKLAKRGYQEHLGDLLLQVNFNSYYTVSVVNR